jgi:hypothetical protein
MIAEGSDWCWWYGPEHQSDNRSEFDELYRQHLANVYRALNLPVPDELSRPILTTYSTDLHEPPANLIHPMIDGEVTSYFEWMGAGHYHIDARSGAMHGQRTGVRDLYYGVDDQNLYLRLDLDGAAETRIELRTTQGSIPLLGNPQVESALRKILEMRVPFHLLGLSKDQPLRFQLTVGNDTIPAEGWIELNSNY